MNAAAKRAVLESDKRWAIHASKRYFPRQAIALHNIAAELGVDAGKLIADHTRKYWRWRLRADHDERHGG